MIELYIHMEDNNMNKNQIAAKKLANNVTTNNMDSNCPVISIYDAIINCWELASKYVFTYDILFVLIFLKNNWKFTNDEMNTLEVLVHSINTPTLN